jgi:hypothetical protein
MHKGHRSAGAQARLAEHLPDSLDDGQRGGDVDGIGPAEQLGQALFGDTQDVLAASEVLDIARHQLGGDLPSRLDVAGDKRRIDIPLMEGIDDAEYAQPGLALADAQGRTTVGQWFREFALGAIADNLTIKWLAGQPSPTVVGLGWYCDTNAPEAYVDLDGERRPEQKALVAPAVVTDDLQKLACLPVGGQLRCSKGHPVEIADGARLADCQRMLAHD